MLIGINNLHVLRQPAQEAATRLDALLTWLAAEQPKSRVVVLAPLPTKVVAYQELTTRFQTVLAAHPEVRRAALRWGAGGRGGGAGAGCSSTLPAALFVFALHAPPLPHSQFPA